MGPTSCVAALSTHILYLLVIILDRLVNLTEPRPYQTSKMYGSSPFGSASGPGSGSSPPGHGPGCQPTFGSPSNPLLSSSTIRRDGRSPETALLSAGLSNNPNVDHTYLANHYDQWIRVNAAEGRQYTALGFRVYVPWVMTVVSEWMNPNRVPVTTNAFERQIDEVYDTEDQLAGRNPEQGRKLFGNKTEFVADTTQL
jgi:hypothetical protein